MNNDKYMFKIYCIFYNKTKKMNITTIFLRNHSFCFVYTKRLYKYICWLASSERALGHTINISYIVGKNRGWVGQLVDTYYCFRKYFKKFNR